jgi:hypothetical protein
MAVYEVGNCLRGYFFGEFKTDDEAWDKLSDTFSKAHPSRSGRGIHMKKVVREGKTKGGNETDRDRLWREKIEANLAQSSELSK